MDHPGKMSHFSAAKAPSHTLAIPSKCLHGSCKDLQATTHLNPQFSLARLRQLDPELLRGRRNFWSSIATREEWYDCSLSPDRVEQEGMLGG